MYEIEAWWQNASAEPFRASAHSLTAALVTAFMLMFSGKHTTITIRTPDALEIARLWGQVKDFP